jgi:hypothetical protein
MHLNMMRANARTAINQALTFIPALQSPVFRSKIAWRVVHDAGVAAGAPLHAVDEADACAGCMSALQESAALRAEGACRAKNARPRAQYPEWM